MARKARRTRKNPRRQSAKARAASMRNLAKARAARKNPSRKRSVAGLKRRITVRENPRAKKAKAKAFPGGTRTVTLRNAPVGARITAHYGNGPGSQIFATNVGGIRKNPRARRSSRTGRFTRR